MDPNFFSVVKKEYLSVGSSSIGGITQGRQVQLVQPMEGLHDSGPPPFLTKVYDMVDDLNFDHILCWSRDGQSFVVWDPHAFSTNLLPRYFKHNNFSSFIRQLNTYGFRKIDPDTWEFANKSFIKGQKHLLKNIKRRKPSSNQPPQPPPPPTNNPCVELGRFVFDGEIGRLRHDKHVLMMELVKLKQQHQNTRARLQEMELRLQGTEKRQQKTMRFLAKALQNPEFVQKIARLGEKKELEETMIKKRKRLIDYRGESFEKGEEFGEFSGVQVCELEELALEMQGIGTSNRIQEEECKEIGGNQDFDDVFWEELFGEHFESEVRYIG